MSGRPDIPAPAPTSTTGSTSGSTSTGTRASRRLRPADRTGSTTRRGATTRARGAAAPRALTWSGAGDALALLLLLGTVVVGFGPVWGAPGYLRPAVGGALLGLAVAWLGAWRRWPTVVVAAATVAAYLLCGGVLALPGTTVGGVLPTLATVRELALGSVHGWKEFVTTVPPLHSFPDLAVVPFSVLYLVAVVAGTVAWRARLAAFALVPVAVGLVAAILLGTVEPALPVVQGLVAGVVGLLWGALRVIEARVGSHSVATDSSREASRRLRWYRLRTGATILGVGAVAAGLVAPVLLPAAPRTVVRDVITPPLDLHEFVSPLVGFRKFAKEQREDELLRVDGLPAGARLRLATLDTYDGVVYDASSDEPGSGVYTRAGEEIATADTTPSTQLDVAVLGYAGVWVPDAGSVTGITWTGDRADQLADSTYYNAATRTALATAGLRPGDTYRLSAQIAAPPTEEDLRSGRIAEDTPLPPLPDDAVPPSVAAKASQFMGEETDPVARLFALREGLVASGIFSSGLEDQAPSRPGHSADRVDSLLAEDEMVGDDEQFAVALALMAQQAGIPARVVMGFYADPETDARQDGETYTVTGADVHAWVEVPFEGYGWAPIDAIPDEDNKIQPEPKSEQVPKPPVLEDPEPPEEPADAVPGDVQDDDKDDQDAEGFDWGLAARIAAAVLIPLAILLAPVLLVLALKARRRLLRRSAARLSDRVAGGWREVLDAATDLGAAVPEGATRREAAGVLVATLEAPETVPLAHRADATVFGAAEPTPQEVDAYWAEVEALLGGLHARVPRRQRWRARLSLRSLRGARGWAALRDLVRRKPSVAPSPGATGRVGTDGETEGEA
jgi:transglutaminase-like putative cysteine protease